MTSYNTPFVLARLLLPSDLLNYFDIVKIEDVDDMLTIYLDEQNIKPSNCSGDALESKGFLAALHLRDFPIRDRKVTLCVRRRKWVNKQTGESFSNSFDLTAQGTRHSKEFADFLKGLLGEIPDYGPLS